VIRVLIVEEQGEVEIVYDLKLQGIADIVAAQAEAEKYREAEFENPLTELLIDAFVSVYGAEGNITAPMVRAFRQIHVTRPQICVSSFIS
jgi:hypothetical protein